MQMPALLTADLKKYSQITSQEVLLNTLMKTPADFVQFFSIACNDETWCEKFSDFMKKGIGWLTIQYFQDKLSRELAKKAAKAIQKHFKHLKERLTFNILCALEDKTAPISSLLFGANCDFFHELIIKECRDKNKLKLPIPQVRGQLFEPIQEFVYTGAIEHLWKKDQNELYKILRQAAAWHMLDLVEICGYALKKYLNEANAIDLLLLARQENWFKIRQDCCEFINGLHLGVRLEERSSFIFAIEFLDFRDKALGVFEKVKSFITHFICNGSIIEDPKFGITLKKCPKLICLDISGSRFFSERFKEIPSSLQELNLSQCSWLTNAYLKKMIDQCPNLRKISLKNNVQISSQGWGELIRLRQLKELDLSHCIQIRDEDLKLILHACMGVTDLNLAECKQITDKAFFDLARISGRLATLGLAKTCISDTALIEMAARCRGLISLDLTRCESLTDRGLVESVRNLGSLRTLSITGCKLSPLAFDQIRKLKPFLKVEGAPTSSSPFRFATKS